MYGNLYLVSTPIGNLEDLTFRAVKILSSVDIILAESVERTKKLLSHYDIDGKVISFNKDNEKRKIENIMDNKIFFTKTSIDNFIIFSILRIYSGNKTIFGAEQLPS